MDSHSQGAQSQPHLMNSLFYASHLGADADTLSAAAALHQATMRVNSLTLSETPQLRKRNREEDDHSFRVDKMGEAPSTIPRAQATISHEEYVKQQQQQMGPMSQFARDDSLTFNPHFPFALPHSTSTGSNGSGSFRNLLSPQDSLNQDANVLQNMEKSIFHSQTSQSLTPPNMTGQEKSFTYGIGGDGHVPMAFVPVSAPFAFLQSGSGMGNSGFLMSSQGSGLAPLQSQTSDLSLPSQTSLNLGASSSGLGLQQGLSTGNSGLGLGSSQSSMQLGGNGFVGMGIPMTGLGFGAPAGMSMGGALGQPTFLSFGAVPRGTGFDPSFMQHNGSNGAGAGMFAQYPPYPTAPHPHGDGGSGSRRSPLVPAESKARRSNATASSAAAATAARAKASSSNNSDSGGEKYVSWTQEQENALSQAAHDLGTNDWEAIAARIPGAHRTGAQCLRHWENKLSPHIKRGQWSPEEDEALRVLVEKAAAQGLSILDIPWEDIKPYIPGRTLKQVRERWRSNLDPNIVRGEWTAFEDDMIVKMRDEQGMGWASIARALKGRTEHSVKTRHRSMQRAKKRPWSEKEDYTIVNMVQQGRDFAAIALELKNRTAASVEQRWSELQSKGTVQN